MPYYIAGAGAFSIFCGLFPWAHEPTWAQHIEDAFCIAVGALAMATGVISAVRG